VLSFAITAAAVPAAQLFMKKGFLLRQLTAVATRATLYAMLRKRAVTAAILTACAALVHACGGVPDVCGDATSDLVIIMAPELQGCTVTSQGACTALKCGCPTAAGCSKWFGETLGSIGSVCSLTMVCKDANGRSTFSRPTFPIGESCGRPAPSTFRMLPNNLLPRVPTSTAAAKDCANVQTQSGFDGDTDWLFKRGRARD
jgi:hypothetical protein